MRTAQGKVVFGQQPTVTVLEVAHLAECPNLALQAAVRPPTFVFFVNDPKLFTDEYRRYVETQLRSNVGFPGTPVRLYWRGKTMSLASARDARQQPSKAA